MKIILDRHWLLIIELCQVPKRSFFNHCRKTLPRKTTHTTITAKDFGLCDTIMNTVLGPKDDQSYPNIAIYASQSPNLSPRKIAGTLDMESHTVAEQHYEEEEAFTGRTSLSLCRRDLHVATHSPQLPTFLPAS